MPLPHAFYAGPLPTYAPPPVPPPSAPYQPPHQLDPALLAALHSAPARDFNNPGDWFLDTCAASHMASNPGTLTVRSSSSLPSRIVVGNGASMPITHSGHTVILTPSSSLQLHNILVSPSLIKNLISVRALTRDNSISIEFDPFGFTVKDLHTRVALFRSDSTGDLYPLRPSPPCSATPQSFSVTVDTWHARLGHPGRDVQQRILQFFPFTCTPSSSHSCHACRIGKHVRLPFSESLSISTVPFQLVHCDLWTSPIPSNSGLKYYLVVLDDFYHYTWTFPLRRESDVPTTLINFHAYVRTQFNLPIQIQCLQTDNGREFDNGVPRSFFSSQGIILRLTCPYTSQQNGRAERVLRTINDSVRTLLFHAGIPPRLWPDALATSTHLLNLRPTRARAHATPHQLLLGTAPSYDHLRTFGCLCYPNSIATAPHKLAPRSQACAFLGYPPGTKGYRCYDPSTRRVLTSRHISFDETRFPFQELTATRSSTAATPACPAPLFLPQLVPIPVAAAPGNTAVEAPRATSPSSPAVVRNEPTAAMNLSSAAMPAAAASSSTAAASSSAAAGPSPAAAAASSQPASTSIAAQSSYPAAGLSSSEDEQPPSPPGMVTRARSGIPLPSRRYNSDEYVCAASTSAPSPLPSSVRVAVRDPHWFAAM